MHLLLHVFACCQDRSRSPTPESSSGTPLDMEDVVRIFGLGQRDLLRSSKVINASDLAARQLAVAMSSCTTIVTPADLKDMGADAASCLHVHDKHSWRL